MEFFAADGMKKEYFKKDLMCHYEILRPEVEHENFTRLNTFIIKLNLFAPLARQKVLFSFAGYNNDKWELNYLREVVEYAKEILRIHPYFWYYATPEQSEFFYLALFVNEDDYTIVDILENRKFCVKRNAEKLKHLFDAMSHNLNVFGEEIRDEDGAEDSFKIWAYKIIDDIPHSTEIP